MNKYTLYYHQQGIRAIQSVDFISCSLEDALRAFCFRCINEDDTGIFFELENADLEALKQNPLFYSVENKFGAFGIELDSYSVDSDSVQIKTAVAEYTGGGIYVYVGEFSDGSWFMSGDLCGNSVQIVNADPTRAWDDAWYPEWQEEHLIRETVDGALLRAILVAVERSLEGGANMNATLEDIRTRIQILDEDGEI